MLREKATIPYQHQEVDQGEWNNDGAEDGRGDNDDDQRHQHRRPCHKEYADRVRQLRIEYFHVLNVSKP